MKKALLVLVATIGLCGVPRSNDLPGRPLKDAERIARSFLNKVGVAMGTLRSSHRDQDLLGQGFWRLTFNLKPEGNFVYCKVLDEPDIVGHVMMGDETAREVHGATMHPAVIKTANDAQAALARLWSRLGFKYPYRLTNFHYSQDRLTPARIGHGAQARTLMRFDAGNLSGNFELLIDKYAFVDRRMSVLVEANPMDGGLLTYGWDLGHPATGQPRWALSRKQAFARLTFLPRGSFPEDWHPELGWYLPDGGKVATLGWHFQQDLTSRNAFIVDAVTGAVIPLATRKNPRLLK